MKALCDFANAEAPEGVFASALRAILLHFMLAYGHPFPDGNGRTGAGLILLGNGALRLLVNGVYFHF